MVAWSLALPAATALTATQTVSENGKPHPYVYAGDSPFGSNALVYLGYLPSKLGFTLTRKDFHLRNDLPHAPCLSGLVASTAPRGGLCPRDQRVPKHLTDYPLNLFMDLSIPIVPIEKEKPIGKNN